MVIRETDAEFLSRNLKKGDYFQIYKVVRGLWYINVENGMGGRDVNWIHLGRGARWGIGASSCDCGNEP
jgi:hypothetical protein